MKKIIDNYYIAVADDFEDLERTVNHKMRNELDWEPIGGVFVNSQPQAGEFKYAQAMVQFHYEE